MLSHFSMDQTKLDVWRSSVDRSWRHLSGIFTPTHTPTPVSTPTPLSDRSGAFSLIRDDDTLQSIRSISRGTSLSLHSDHDEQIVSEFMITDPQRVEL